MADTIIAVIGAGFSGTLTALHLLRRCPRTTRVCLIGHDAGFGRGQAYATGNPGHLLNVPAGRMSAFPDDPTQFLRWLGANPGEGEAEAGSFAPRRAFGAYVRQLLDEELAHPERGGRLELLRGDAVGLRCGDRLQVGMDGGRTVAADAVVLALGNFPPEPPPVADPGFYDTACYRPDPWAPDALSGLDPADPVLLIGTGLTMVDTVVSLLDAGHTGPIHALSRRGLLPHRHAEAHGGAPAQEGPAYPTELVRLMRQLRAQAREAGGDWRPVVDALRPFTADLWQGMSLPDRRRFLRHLRPWWDIHRHRMAPAVAARIDRALASGQLRIRAGRIKEYRDAANGVEVAFRPRGEDGLATLAAVRVVNCSGAASDYARVAHPLVRDLLRTGEVRPDPMRLGLDVTAQGAVLRRDGAISRRVFAVGPVTRGAVWEMTAVPDIRRQAEQLAAHLAALVRPARVPAVTGDRPAAAD